VTVLRLRRRLAFCRQLLSLVKAGLPVSSVFTDLAQAYGPGMRDAFRRGGQRLRDGSSLVEALQELRKLVDPLTRALLAGAEQAGRIEELLLKRVQQLEEAQRFVGRMVVLSLYPMYLLGGLVLFGPLLSLPAAVMGGATAGSLPAVYLHGMFGMSLVVVGVLAGLFCLPLVVALLAAERAVDRTILRLPVFGSLYRKLYGARLVCALGGALGAGLDVSRALEIAVAGMDSPSLSPRRKEAQARLVAGGTLTDTLAEIGVLDSGSLGQVAVAERTGNLEQVLGQLSLDLWDEVVRRARIAAFLVIGMLVVLLSAVAVVKILGVIFGPIADAYRADGGLPCVRIGHTAGLVPSMCRKQAPGLAVEKGLEPWRIRPR
jgi:type IV pilus assembly protein PilC